MMGTGLRLTRVKCFRRVFGVSFSSFDWTGTWRGNSFSALTEYAVAIFKGSREKRERETAFDASASDKCHAGR
jgi:hypothetical protein